MNMELAQTEDVRDHSDQHHTPISISKGRRSTRIQTSPTHDELVKELLAARRAMTKMMNRLGLYDEGRNIATRAIKRVTAVIEASNPPHGTTDSE